MKMKETLQLGKTKFPMRGNLPNREGEWQKEWEENQIYQKRQELNEVFNECPKWIFPLA